MGSLNLGKRNEHLDWGFKNKTQSRADFKVQSSMAQRTQKKGQTKTFFELADDPLLSGRTPRALEKGDSAI